MKFITAEKLRKDLGLEKLNNIKSQGARIKTTEINRPGIQFSGFFDGFPYSRIQLVGKIEKQFLNTLAKERREEIFENFFSYDIPCIIISRQLEAPIELLKAAEKHQKNVFRSSLNTTKLLNILTNYLEDCLAPTTRIHGVLMDIHGIGTLITGKSGIGKSEAAIELINKGHLLVADDAVEVKRIGQEYLTGYAPDITRYMLEVRGIGIMDIKTLYGVGAIKFRTNINLVIRLEEWDINEPYDRLGLDERYREILGIKVAEVVIPVKPARNIAVIAEVAAKNYRLKNMGYHSAKSFSDRLTKYLTKK